MNVLGILPFARNLLESCCTAGDFVIDATAGNGHDTKFLAELVGGTGHVFSFDIQEAAIMATKSRLVENKLLSRVSLFHASHQQAKALIPEEAHGKIAAAIFNLGYLPGGDKTITTNAETTLAAITTIFSLVRKGGIIVLVIYHGHPEGEEERDQLLKFAESIHQSEAHVLIYRFINQQNNPPFIIAIEKR